MGSVFKDPKSAMDSATQTKIKSFIKTQRSFDKAYKQTIRTVILSQALAYFAFSLLAIYLASIQNFFNISQFEQYVMENVDINTSFYVSKGIGFF
jgi:hypothetical protein